ncbi:antibiotic biosynthesis monooxygenase [Corynebacterium lizhenjunii]|uniref:Antibiotic biosynthesis monooxygenase n=1 Tax=Corynebacterium lizhenjunii TaxID=2709394 RepID=A0A7T0KE51_9CORY|nr:antibiotic biosynthesis monooxygenase [Corynebacterium lizhenjunii]QPK79115.1 antibiotic biosynthesis monooxygenase [Corynebacterium lizhenjunii]
MLRSIHSAQTAPEGLLSDVRAIRQRAGIHQAEQYVSLVPGEYVTAVTLLAQDEHSFSTLIRELVDYPAFRTLLETGSTELYQQCTFEMHAGKWSPAGREGSVIHWPAQGPVSILIQGAYGANEHMRALTIQEIVDTRREPGCEFYAWMENVELPNHLMLLERWTDQQIYDAHWLGRMATSDYRGDSGRSAVSPVRGVASREFYRQQPFEFHYGRLLPANVRHYSHTVTWTPR